MTTRVASGVMHGCPDDLIAAVASAPGGAPRSIIRISGATVAKCLGQCFVSGIDGRRLEQITQPLATSGHLELSSLNRRLPADLYLWPGPRSFTGQSMGEVHTLGSSPLVQAALQAICRAGARLAEPGEFTLRAFLAGRIDLPQAEAVLGVIDATSQQQFGAALDQLAGGVSRPLNQLRDQLLDLLADLEAGLDFVEEDITFVSAETACEVLSNCLVQIRDLITAVERRSVPLDVPRIMLLGYPNVGKSSLMNALADENRALVSDMPGTTRDYVTARFTLDGIECELVDTAGVDAAHDRDAVASAAQHATADQTRRTELHLLCLDASRPMNNWEQLQSSDASTVPRIVVLTKSDLPRRIRFAEPHVATSSQTEEGLDTLRARIAEQLSKPTLNEGNVVAETALRCHDSLRLARGSLRRARQLAKQKEGDELVASEIRIGLCELGKVVGAVYTDDILDRIFSRFCIGK